MKEDFLSVSQLNQYIKDVIQSGFPQPLWVCGEIQGYDRNRDKNHVFFELVEKDPKSKEVLARIGLVIFSNRKIQIQQILQRSENSFSLKDDIEVKFLCSVDFYPPHGAVRLIVENIDPTYTLGKLAQERQRLIALLKEKGILDKNKQLALPLVPLNIGLITSHDSAAYNDFVEELRKSGYAFQVYLRNTLMQGKKTEKDVCQAIEELEKISALDVIVITRGGGSIAELSCFDSELIAKKIAACRLPFVTGIGHEINVTITDLAAHTFQKTPTATAQLIVSLVGNFLENLDTQFAALCELAEDLLKREKEDLKGIVLNLQEGTRAYLKDHQEKIFLLAQAVTKTPQSLLKNKKQSLREEKELLLKVIKTRFEKQKNNLLHRQKYIDAVNPITTIKRGFSITRTKSGKVVRRTSDLKENEQLLTEVADGTIESQVQQIIKQRG